MMETEVVQSSSIPEIEKDTIYLHENAIKKLNEGLEPDETGNADELVQRKVHKFYFAKLWPHQDQNFKSRIAEAEKLIEKMDQEMFPVHQKHMDLWPYRERLRIQLKRLYNHKYRIKNALGWKKAALDDLNVALDKLNFANNANQRTAVNSCSSRELINFMVHRPNNLLTKKISSERSKEIRRKELLIHIHQKKIGPNSIECQNNKELKKKIINEIKQLECVGKKAIGNATEKGKIENPLNSRKAIQDRVNLINKISEELRKEHLEVSAKFSCVQKDIDAIDKEINPLWRQWSGIWLKKEEVKRHIENLMKQQEEARATHNRYVSVMSNARELARKKDVKALQELSLREIMETEVVQSSSIPEIEKDTMYLQENASKKLNEGLEPDETGNADEFVQKKVQKFYFAKLWPYQDQNFKSRIAEAEKLIEKMDQDMFPVHQKHMDLLSYQGRMHVQLKHLRNHKTRIEIAMGRKIGKLDDLNVALDKLTFANNANRRTAINSCSSRELINFMVHRPNNLLTKKKLFREIKESQE
ncbi:hypothetical protein ACOSP7_002356 [Xanthoceras sorbifolium]